MEEIMKLFCLHFKHHFQLRMRVGVGSTMDK